MKGAGFVLARPGMGPRRHAPRERGKEWGDGTTRGEQMGHATAIRFAPADPALARAPCGDPRAAAFDGSRRVRGRSARTPTGRCSATPTRCSTTQTSPQINTDTVGGRARTSSWRTTAAIACHGHAGVAVSETLDLRVRLPADVEYLQAVLDGAASWRAACRPSSWGTRAWRPCGPTWSISPGTPTRRRDGAAGDRATH